jgi:hypothetical protein
MMRLGATCPVDLRTVDRSERWAAYWAPTPPSLWRWRPREACVVCCYAGRISESLTGETAEVAPQSSSNTFQLPFTALTVFFPLEFQALTTRPETQR